MPVEPAADHRVVAGAGLLRNVQAHHHPAVKNPAHDMDDRVTIVGVNVAPVRQPYANMEAAGSLFCRWHLLAFLLGLISLG